MFSVIRIAAEFAVSFIKLKSLRVSNTILFFGSARIKPLKELEKKIANPSSNEKAIQKAKTLLTTASYYEDTYQISYEVSKWIKSQKLDSKYSVATGGGPGIMEAGNKGAFKAGIKSIGFNIKLPFEQSANRYITPQLSFDYKYFFCRKYWMLKTARVIVICPGGYGTLDELFETLTLMQTLKIRRTIPIVFYDGVFFKDLISFIGKLADEGLIGKEDMKLYKVANSKEEATEIIKQAIRNHNA